MKLNEPRDGAVRTRRQVADMLGISLIAVRSAEKSAKRKLGVLLEEVYMEHLQAIEDEARPHNGRGARRAWLRCVGGVHGGADVA